MDKQMAGTLPAVVVGDPAERLAALFDVHYDRLYRLGEATRTQHR